MSTNLDKLLARGREISEKATPGPWSMKTELRGCTWPGEFQLIENPIFNFGWDGEEGIYLDNKNDAAFISESRTLVPKLIAIVEAQAKTLENLDDWQGRQSCNASVYEIEDDEFGFMQFFIHDALAEVERLAGGLITNHDS